MRKSYKLSILLQDVEFSPDEDWLFETLAYQRVIAEIPKVGSLLWFTRDPRASTIEAYLQQATPWQVTLVYTLTHLPRPDKNAVINRLQELKEAIETIRIYGDLVAVDEFVLMPGKLLVEAMRRLDPHPEARFRSVADEFQGKAEEAEQVDKNVAAMMQQQVEHYRFLMEVFDE